MKQKTLRQMLQERGRYDNQLSPEEVKKNVAETKVILEKLEMRTQAYSTDSLLHDFRVLRRGWGDE